MNEKYESGDPVWLAGPEDVYPRRALVVGVGKDKVVVWVEEHCEAVGPQFLSRRDA